MIDFEHYKKILVKRRQELVKRLENIEDLLDDPKTKDVEDWAAETEGDEVLQIQGSSGLVEIKSIDAALKRIELGNYGVCPICGNEISSQRLNAVPHASQCINCM